MQGCKLLNLQINRQYIHILSLLPVYMTLEYMFSALLYCFLCLFVAVYMQIHVLLHIIWYMLLSHDITALIYSLHQP